MGPDAFFRYAHTYQLRKAMRRPRRKRFSERIEILCHRAGVADPRDAALLMVQKLFREYGKQNPPFDAHELCRLQSIDPCEQYLFNCDARLLPVAGGYIAEVHAGHSKRRQRFSLGHEIGHTFCLRGPSHLAQDGFSCSVGDTKQSQLEEYLCNLVAAELLMPHKMFAKIASDYSPGLASVRLIADQFQVSLQAAIRRILELDIWQCFQLRFRSIEVQGISRRIQLEEWQASSSLKRLSLANIGLLREVERILAGGDAQRDLFDAMVLGFKPSFRIKIPNLRTELHVENYSYHTDRGRVCFALLFPGGCSAPLGFVNETDLREHAKYSLFPD